MEMAFSLGQMGEFMMENGKMEDRMDMEAIERRMKTQSTGSGKMGRCRNGQIRKFTTSI